MLPISAAVTMRCLGLTRALLTARRRRSAQTCAEGERATVEEKRVVGEREKGRERER